METPDPNAVGVVITAIIGIVVVWDIFMLWRSHELVPELGPIANGGHAWSSTAEQEMMRHWSSIMSIAVMMAAPWILASSIGTSNWLIITFDVLLFTHLIGMLMPKRYAVTRTHLFTDGQVHEWQGLRLALKQPRGRIMLHRKGWGILAPLPLGGEAKDLSLARKWISAAMADNEEWKNLKSLFFEEE